MPASAKVLAALTNHDFLSVVFGDLISRVHVTAFSGDPNSTTQPGVWGGHLYGSATSSNNVTHETHKLNTYYTVSIFKPGKGGKPVRQDALVETLKVLVADDIGSGLGGKIPVKEWVFVMPHKPTYIVETSKNCFQYGYVIGDGGFSGHALATLAENTWTQQVSKLTADGKDPGGGNLTRYVRLPQGVNGKAVHVKANKGKPFKCRLREWNPKVLYDPDKFLVKVLKCDPQTADAAKQGVGSATSSPLRSKGDDIASTGSTHLDPNDDPTGWGRALNERGLLNSAHKDGAWDIECPFIEEHTGKADTGSAFLGDGCFKCHHGHCVDREQGQFRERLEELHPGITQEAAKWAFKLPAGALDDEERDLLGEVEKESAEALAASSSAFTARRYVWMETEGELFDTMTGETVSKASLNTTYDKIKYELAHDLRKWGKGAGTMPKPAESIVGSKFCVMAHHREYAPGEKLIFANPDRGSTTLNTWRDPDVGRGVDPKDLGSPEAKNAINSLVMLTEQLTGDPKLSGLLLDWLALLVGNPGVKPHWQWLMISDPGLGKDMLGVLCAGLLGKANVTHLNAGDLTSQFNPWAASQLVIVNELSSMSGAGRRGGATVYDNMKHYLTAPPDVVMVNTKNVKQFKARNVAGYLMFSNHDIPILMEKKDRRLCVVDQRKAVDLIATTAGGWSVFVDDIVNNPKTWAFLACWLRERWALMDAPRRHAVVAGDPPMTAAKSSIQRASLSAIDEMVEDWTEPDDNAAGGGGGPLWTTSELRERYFAAQRQDKRLGHLGWPMARKKLIDGGMWMPYGHADPVQGRVRGVGPGGGRETVWALYEDTASSDGILENTTPTEKDIRDRMSVYQANRDVVGNVTDMGALPDDEDRLLEKVATPED